VCALILTVASACSGTDTGTGGGGGSGGSGGPVDPLPGHWVECCFSGNFDGTTYSSPKLVSGCQVEPMCADPDDWDLDEDGDLSAAELRPFCQQKCAPSWPGGDAVRPSWDPSGPGGDVLWNCSALTGPPSSVVSMNSCAPPEDYESYGEKFEVAPTHETTFTTGSGSGHGSGNEFSLTVLGNEVEPDAVLDMEYTVDQCDANGYGGGTCRVVLHRFDLSTTSTFAAGDYDVHDVKLELSAPVAAEIDFDDCSIDTCTGSFAFEAGNDNALTMALHWTQENRRYGNRDEGALPIGNDSNWLGGIDALVGEIGINLRTGSGEISVAGGGSDQLSGEFAAVSFSLDGAMVEL